MYETQEVPALVRIGQKFQDVESDFHRNGFFSVEYVLEHSPGADCSYCYIRYMLFKV